MPIYNYQCLTCNAIESYLLSNVNSPKPDECSVCHDRNCLERTFEGQSLSVGSSGENKKDKQKEERKCPPGPHLHVIGIGIPISMIKRRSDPRMN